MKRSQTSGQYELLKVALDPDERREKVADMLKARYRISRRHLRDVFSDPASAADERIVAERLHGLDAMALEPLERSSQPPHNPLVAPSFMRFARAGMAAYILKNPADRSVLKQTVFFAGNEEQRVFARSISAAVRPLDNYDAVSFAAGVALEEIVIAEAS
jgi:hypothetical protein